MCLTGLQPPLRQGRGLAELQGAHLGLAEAWQSCRGHIWGWQRLSQKLYLSLTMFAIQAPLPPPRPKYRAGKPTGVSHVDDRDLLAPWGPNRAALQVEVGLESRLCDGGIPGGGRAH